jgi:hypothetical protein
MSSTPRPLKAQNMKWLILMAASDAIVIVGLVAPGLTKAGALAEISAIRLLLGTVIPVAVLLIVNALPHDVKSMLVYWKPRGVLPGCRAFTELGPADPRVDMAALRNNVGELPTDPSAQNSTWYRLYKQVAEEPEVADAQRQFLMYRDMASMSLPLVLAAPLCLLGSGAAAHVSWIAFALFGVQYILTAISARWAGIRFVCNVLAIQSARKISAKRK